jgi:hypothetical protein
VRETVLNTNVGTKTICHSFKQPPDPQDDREFTIEEIRRAVESMNNRKAPGEDGITGEIFNLAFQTIPKFITALYNGCLRKGQNLYLGKN